MVGRLCVGPVRQSSCLLPQCWYADSWQLPADRLYMVPQVIMKIIKFPARVIQCHAIKKGSRNFPCTFQWCEPGEQTCPLRD